MHRPVAASDVFHAIADSTRRALLDRLLAGELPVNALASDFAQSRPAISAHLRVLREASIVTERRVGRERLYQLRPDALKDVDGWIENYRVFWQHSLTNLKKYLEEAK